MVNALNSGSTCLVFEPCLGTLCCVVGQDAVQMGSTKFNAGGNAVMD